MSSPHSAEDSAKIQEFQHFLDGAVHSFRAPLRGIGTSAALLSQKWNERFDGDARCLLRSILDGVTNLNTLTTALAEYSMSLGRRKSSRAASLPVENALQAAIATLLALIQETGATVHYGPLPRLEADHDQLAVLFRCLLSNALEYRAKTVAPRIEITATAAGDEWRFAVSDNGIGIEPRFHRQIFQPFERLHSSQRAFGLGLAISKKIVTAHGGSLWVDSEEGEGSTFYFTLPMDNPVSR